MFSHRGKTACNIFQDIADEAFSYGAVHQVNGIFKVLPLTCESVCHYRLHVIELSSLVGHALNDVYHGFVAYLTAKDTFLHICRSDDAVFKLRVIFREHFKHRDIIHRELT